MQCILLNPSPQLEAGKPNMAAASSVVVTASTPLLQEQKKRCLRDLPRRNQGIDATSAGRPHSIIHAVVPAHPMLARRTWQNRGSGFREVMGSGSASILQPNLLILQELRLQVLYLLCFCETSLNPISSYRTIFQHASIYSKLET